MKYEGYFFKFKYRGKWYKIFLPREMGYFKWRIYPGVGKQFKAGVRKAKGLGTTWIGVILECTAHGFYDIDMEVNYIFGEEHVVVGKWAVLMDSVKEIK